MILESLYKYAQSHSDELPPAGMEWKEIEYVIVIDENGKFIRFESRRIDKKKCAKFLVAKSVIRSGTAFKANFLWDNGQYVLGKGNNGSICNQLFVETIRKIGKNHPNLAIKALIKFYDLSPSEREHLMEMDPMYPEVLTKMGTNFSFRLLSEDRLIAEDRSLIEAFGSEFSEKLPEGRCSVTGEQGPIVRIFTPTPLPGNSPLAALISFQQNSGYDSYGKKQAFNSPISVKAEAAISGVLKKFLDKDSTHKVRLGNRVFLFWGSGSKEMTDKVEKGLMSIFQSPDKKEESSTIENIEKAEKLFKSIFSGQIKTTLDDNFHILGLAPNTGRITVVMWMDSKLRDFASKILEHFEDMEIVDNRKPENRRPYAGVYSIISAATLGGKVSDALARVIEETVNAVISGTLYPYSLYISTLQRIRAELNERRPGIERVALLKAYINRLQKRKKKILNIPLTVMLDKNNSNPGYLCGRLTAVLEKIQCDVNSGDSIRTRYMGAASTTPAAVLPSMLNLSLHHSEKLSEKDRIFYEKLKQEILDKIPVDGFPATLDLADQGRFFVGYYHQRTDLFTKKEN